MLLASCSYDEAKKYRNKLVLVPEDEKSKKKAEEVVLNIVTDNPDEVIRGGIGSYIRCITSRNMPNSCPKELWGNVFHEVQLEEFTGVSEPDGVVCLIRLPDGFDDMRKVDEISAINKNYDDVEAKVRFIGGNLLEIPGVHIGRYDKGKEKMPAVYNGIYDIFREVDLRDIKVQEVMSKVRKGGKPSSSSSNKVSQSKAKKAEAFARFFGGSGSGF